MNTKILAGLGVVAVVAGGYLYNQDNNITPTLPQLDYIPADTALFWGQLKPFAYSRYFDMLPAAMKNTDDLTPVIESLSQSQDKNSLFLASLLKAYQMSLTSSAAIKQTWGVGDEYQGLGYTVGLLPVMRFKVAQQDALINTINKAATEAGISYTTDSIDGVALTRYAINIDDQTFQLIASVSDGWATLTFNTPFNDEQDLRLALALDKPEESLAQSGKIAGYTKKYDLDGSSIAYVNNIAITNAITAKHPSRLNKMLDAVLDKTNSAQALAAVRTTQCQNDFSDIASNWPATVTGTTEVSITDKQADFSMTSIVESSDQDLMNTLSSVRGFIPKHTASLNNQMLSVAYGVDLAKIPPLANTVIKTLNNANFQCQLLSQYQQQTKELNTMGLAMVSSMANGIQGISFSLQDLRISEDVNGEPKIEKLDALVTLSASNIDTLLFTAKSFLPMMGNITIAEDGQPAVINDLIPSPIPLDFDIKLAKKGQHLVLYTGERSESIANALQSEHLEKNGLFSMGFDFKALIAPVIDLIEMSDQPFPEELEQLKAQTMSLHFNSDIQQHGITVDSSMQIKKEQ